MMRTPLEVVQLARMLEMLDIGPLAHRLLEVARHPEALALLRAPLPCAVDPENGYEAYMVQRRAARVAYMLARVDAELAAMAIDEVMRAEKLSSIVPLKTVNKLFTHY